MSEYEFMNQRARQQQAERRRYAIKRLAVILARALAVMLVLVGLEYIGFISKTFLVILVAITIGAGCFRTGYIWRDIRW